jgi:hypothetical protein
LTTHRGGAIDENIDAAELAEHFCYGSLDGSIIASVGDISLHAAFRSSPDFRGGGLECGGIPSNQSDIHPFLRKLPRDSFADAAVAAGDDRDFISEFQIQRLASLQDFRFGRF